MYDPTFQDSDSEGEEWKNPLELLDATSSSNNDIRSGLLGIGETNDCVAENDGRRRHLSSAAETDGRSHPSGSLLNDCRGSHPLCAAEDDGGIYQSSGVSENDGRRNHPSGLLVNDGRSSHPSGATENDDRRSLSGSIAENDGRSNQDTGTGVAVMSRMALNTNKAGMEGLDKEKINRIILEASKGSRFYENERKKESEMDQRLAVMKQKLKMITQKDKQKAIKVMDGLAEQSESARDLSRTIVHLDMDAFYAAVEMRDNPSLKNKPMAVGSMSMLSTSNYAARRFGVRAAMPGFIAKKLCPDLVLVPAHFDKYREASKQVREILKEYDPNFCPMSLDEAYFDLTNHLARRRTLTNDQRTYYKHGHCAEKNIKCNLSDKKEEMKCSDISNRGEIDEADDGRCVQEESAENAGEDCVTFGLTDEDAVNEIRFRIHAKTQLTASAGIAPNTMLAKVCSDKNKPNGQYKIEPTREAVMDFVRTLPIRKISGIGKVTEKMLKSLDIETCQDLFVKRGIVHLLFSEISSHQFLQTSLGLGSTRVQRSSERKSISVERTFRELSKPAELYLKLNELCQSLANDLKEEELMGRTITIKLKTVKFDVKSRSTSISNAVNSLDAIYTSTSELLRLEINACQPESLKLRLMGVRMSSLISANAIQTKQGTIKNFFKKTKPISAKNEEFGKHPYESLQGKDNNSAAMFSEVDYQSTSHQQSIYNPLNSDAGLEYRTTSDRVTESQLISPSANNPDFPTSPGQFNADVSDGAVQDRPLEFVCPICNTAQTYNNLDRFNEHVDLCLNDKEIKSILSEQERNFHQKTVSPSKTSKRSCRYETSSAKRRRNHDNQSTIDKFLKY